MRHDELPSWQTPVHDSERRQLRSQNFLKTCEWLVLLLGPNTLGLYIFANFTNNESLMVILVGPSIVAWFSLGVWASFGMKSVATHKRLLVAAFAFISDPSTNLGIYCHR